MLEGKFVMLAVRDFLGLFRATESPYPYSVCGRHRYVCAVLSTIR